MMTNHTTRWWWCWRYVCVPWPHGRSLFGIETLGDFRGQWARDLHKSSSLQQTFISPPARTRERRGGGGRSLWVSGGRFSSWRASVYLLPYIMHLQGHFIHHLWVRYPVCCLLVPVCTLRWSELICMVCTGLQQHACKLTAKWGPGFDWAWHQWYVCKYK